MTTQLLMIVGSIPGVISSVMIERDRDLGRLHRPAPAGWDRPPPPAPVCAAVARAGVVADIDRHQRALARIVPGPDGAGARDPGAWAASAS